MWYVKTNKCWKPFNNDIIQGNPLEFDLVDEMMWEDLVEFETLESAGLEDSYCGDTVPAAQSEYYKDEA